MQPRTNAVLEKIWKQGQVRTHLYQFGGLNDFLLGAEPEEEWLFACPPDERPFDFMDALQEGSETPFFWLSLTDYLRRQGEAAFIDNRRRLAEEEWGTSS